MNLIRDLNRANFQILVQLSVLSGFLSSHEICQRNGTVSSASDSEDEREKVPKIFSVGTARLFNFRLESPDLESLKGSLLSEIGSTAMKS